MYCSLLFTVVVTAVFELGKPLFIIKLMVFFRGLKLMSKSSDICLDQMKSTTNFTGTTQHLRHH